LVGAVPDSPEYRHSLALALLDRAMVELELHRVPDAATDLAESLPIIAKLDVENPEIGFYQRDYAAALEARGRLLHLTGQDAEARTALDTALDVFLKLADERPDILD